MEEGASVGVSADDGVVSKGTANQARVYEYADLTKWWVEHGKEPAPFGAFSLDQLWRTAE